MVNKCAKAEQCHPYDLLYSLFFAFVIDSKKRGTPKDQDEKILWMILRACLQKVSHGNCLMSSIQALGTASLHLLQFCNKVFVQHMINCILAVIFALTPLSIDENDESLQTQSVSMLHFICSVGVLHLINKFLVGIITLFILRHACRIENSRSCHYQNQNCLLLLLLLLV